MQCLVCSVGCTTGLRMKKAPVPRASSSDTNIHQVVRASFSTLSQHFKRRINFTIMCLLASFYSHFSQALPHITKLMEIPNDEPKALNMTEQKPLREQARGTIACTTVPRCCFEE